MRASLALLVSLLPAAVLGQAAPTPMFKCLDERRQVTYSNLACEKQGLRDGGVVADRTTVMPFTELPKPKAAPGKPVAPAEPPTTKLQPANPLVEKAVK
jgi:hypothetical protein